MIAILLASAIVQASTGAPDATAAITVHSALKVSSVTPIQLRTSALNNPAIIDVSADPNRAYRLQVQTYLLQADGETSPTSAAWADASPTASPTSAAWADASPTPLPHVDANGNARIKLPDIDGFLRHTATGVPMLPVRVVYE